MLRSIKYQINEETYSIKTQFNSMLTKKVNDISFLKWREEIEGVLLYIQ